MTEGADENSSLLDRPIVLVEQWECHADTRGSRSMKGDQGGRMQQQDPPCFNGRLESKHATEDGSQYLHFVFGGKDSAGQACRNIGTIDAEFIFLSGVAFSVHK